MLLPIGVQGFFRQQRTGLEPQIIHGPVLDLQEQESAPRLDPGHRIIAAHRIEALLGQSPIGKALPAARFEVLHPQGHFCSVALELRQICRFQLRQRSLEISCP